MPARLSLVILITACAGPAPIVTDSADDDAPICDFDTDYYCDYRPSELFATCTDYSAQAYEYLNAQSIDNSGSEEYAFAPVQRTISMGLSIG